MFDRQCLAAVGITFGDEGKGKVIDYLASNKNYDAVVRFTGGPNAGHGIKINDKIRLELNHLPSGCASGKMCIIGPECYVNPKTLEIEIEYVRKTNPDVNFDLYIDKKCIVITDEDIKADHPNDGLLTTGKGIGPAAARRANRTAMTVLGNEILTSIEGVFIVNTFDLVNDLISNGKRILFEGSQSVQLDLVHGDYPFVSQRTMPANVLTSFGMRKELRDLEILGISKIYNTRTGAGRMDRLVEFSKTIETIRTIGMEYEYGDPNNRPMVLGWLDIEELKHVIELAGVTGLCFTKTDMIEKIDGFRVYSKWGGHLIKNFEAFSFFMKNNLNTPCVLFGSGPERHQMIESGFVPVTWSTGTFEVTKGDFVGIAADGTIRKI